MAMAKPAPRGRPGMRRLVATLALLVIVLLVLIQFGPAWLFG